MRKFSWFVARVVSQKLTEMWGQNVAVDNRTGAGGNIGGEIVARAMPDGHTVLMTNGTIVTAHQFLHKDMPFNPDSEYGMDERGSLRFRTDAARNRLWVLGVDDVRVYDAAKNQLIGKVVLPNWSVARFICAPELGASKGRTKSTPGTPRRTAKPGPLKFLEAP